MTKASVLTQPDTVAAEKGIRPIIIYTDVSEEGLGAVLCQEVEDKLLHPIAFTSRGLSKAERRCHITNLKALALALALKKFHFFAYGLKRNVATDQSAVNVFVKENERFG